MALRWLVRTYSMNSDPKYPGKSVPKQICYEQMGENIYQPQPGNHPFKMRLRIANTFEENFLTT